MLLGAIIGMIVAIIVILIKNNREKKALSKLNNSDTLDSPDYTAYFHVASENTFKSKGFKFFDASGVLFLSGKNLVFNDRAVSSSTEFNLATSSISYAGVKKKMKWVCIEQKDSKLYFTTFKQGLLALDKTEMDRFIEKLKLLNPGSNLAKG